MKKNYQQGQTLIETLAALAIIAIVISAISMLVITTLNNAKSDQYETLAAKYSQQGTEIVQQIRDTNYTAFETLNTASNMYYCLGKGQTSLGSQSTDCSTNKVDNFIRTIQIQKDGCGTNVAQVTVTVSFTDGKCQAGQYCHKQVETTCLSTANPVQAP